MCLDKYPVGVMGETGDFCLGAPLCSQNWWGTGWGGFSRTNGIMDADGMMSGHMAGVHQLLC